MTRPPWRTGHRWRQLRARAIRRDTTCYLCGHPLHHDLPWPHPQSTSIDHIEPASHNETIALKLDNLACTHKLCNEKKGARSAGDIDRNSTAW